MTEMSGHGRLGGFLCILRLSLFAFLIYSVELSAETRLSVGPLSGPPLSSHLIKVSLETDELIAGIQMDVSFDPSLVLVSAVDEAGVDGPSGRYWAHSTQAGRLRIVVMPSPGGTLASGILTKIPVTLLAEQPVPRALFALSRVDISDRYGLSLSFSAGSFMDIAIDGSSGNQVQPGTPVTVEAVAFGTNGNPQALELTVNGRQLGFSSDGRIQVSYIFLEPGISLVTAMTRASGNQPASRLDKEVVVEGTVIRSFSQWQNFWFSADQLANPTISSLQADWDGDQKNNLREYIEGTNPLEADQPDFPTGAFILTEAGNRYLAMRIPQRADASDLEFNFSAVDTVTSTAAPGTGSLVFVGSEVFGNIEVQTWRDSLPLSDKSIRFLKAAATIK